MGPQCKPERTAGKENIHWDVYCTGNLSSAFIQKLHRQNVKSVKSFMKCQQIVKKKDQKFPLLKTTSYQSSCQLFFYRSTNHAISTAARWPQTTAHICGVIVNQSQTRLGEKKRDNCLFWQRKLSTKHWRRTRTVRQRWERMKPGWVIRLANCPLTPTAITLISRHMSL